MCPKIESDDENFFKLEGIIEIKNDRNLDDKYELSQKLFGQKITHHIENEFDSEIIDENLKLKTYYLAGFTSSIF